MGAKYINVDRETPMMLPPCLQEWLPQDSMLILGKYVTNHANDKLELTPGLASVDPAVRKVDTASADTGIQL